MVSELYLLVDQKLPMKPRLIRNAIGCRRLLWCWRVD